MKFFSFLPAGLTHFFGVLLGMSSSEFTRKEPVLNNDFDQIELLERQLKPLKGTMKTGDWNKQVELRKQLKKVKRSNAAFLEATGLN